jgi:hypothetical protein
MSSGTRSYFLNALGAGAILAGALASAQAQSVGAKAAIREPVTAAGCIPEAGKPYFVEFRARTAASYGHSFLFHGRLGASGKFGKFEVAGLHPRGDDPAVYLQGHVVPVPADTGASNGDLDEQYLTARYCVVLGETEYARVAGYIRRLQATSKEWHAPTKNCNGFLGDVAEFMRLKTPPTHLLYPESYVNMMRDLNGNGRSVSSLMPSIPYEQWGLPRPKR